MQIEEVKLGVNVRLVRKVFIVTGNYKVSSSADNADNVHHSLRCRIWCRSAGWWTLTWTVAWYACTDSVGRDSDITAGRAGTSCAAIAPLSKPICSISRRKMALECV